VNISLYFIISEINRELIQRVNKPEVVITVYQCAGNIIFREEVICSEEIASSFNFFYLDTLSLGYHENSSSDSWHLSPLLLGQHVQP
jgi:hypothetical protein